MENTIKTKVPTWFWVVSGLALVWNLAGVMNYLSQAYMTDEIKGALPEDQAALLESTPSWVTAAFAIAVFAGALGCLALLLRKKWARPVLLLSLLGIIVQQIYIFFLSDSFEVYGSGAMFLPIVVIVVGIALVYFARMAQNKGWLS